MTTATPSTSDSPQLQIKFVTKQEDYSVPDTTFAVPSSIKIDELNSLLNELLKEGQEEKKKVKFDFLALGQFIRGELGEHLTNLGGSSESVILVEYLERLPAPEPKDCLLHDDWVSAVHLSGKWILTGCYDNTLHLWTAKGKHRLTIPGHTACVKAVSWVTLDDSRGVFISGSHDQTVLLWEWSVEDSLVECVHVCKGHSRGIECLAVSPDTERFVSAGWDTHIKIWSTDLNVSLEDDDGQSDAKQIKKSNKKKQSQIRSPLLTLKGHREAVSGACWRTGPELVTSSWDHTLRLWDSEVGTSIQEIPTNKALFDVHSHLSSGHLLVASADRHVRLIDPKSNEGSVVKSTYSSHSQWVQSVRWAPDHEYLFISGGYDNLVKLWDTRSPKVPLYDMTGHEDKVLCSDWSDPSLILSGGADNTLRIYKSRTFPKEVSDILDS